MTRHRRKVIGFAPLFLVCTTLAGLAPVQAEALRFTILRDGAEVGVHEVRRTEVAGETRVSSSSRIDVGLLGLNFYSFRYRSQEVWDERGLIRLDVDVDDDGKPFRLSGERVAGRFSWTSDRGDGEHPLPLYPTNHWNPGVLQQDRVLNTLTGRLNQVEILSQGRELLDLPTAKILATRYRYRGELELESWYGSDGQWLGMRFEGRDGSIIEYLCSNCDQRVAM